MNYIADFQAGSEWSEQAGQVHCTQQRRNRFKERAMLQIAHRGAGSNNNVPTRTDQLTLRPASHHLPRLLSGTVLQPNKDID